ncbi:MAG: spermidine synthase [Magnetococcales bacterium]|nr:spermidine synthase [Magnetococcales bacterium]
MDPIPAASPILFQHDWQGRNLMVVDEGEYRSLYFDNQMTQSRMQKEHPLWLVLPYTRYMLACLLFNPHPRHMFMIGLGGGSLVKFFLHYFPECQIDVVDANPEMGMIAQHFFFLPQEERLTIHCADGETFVAGMSNPPLLYDLILVDAFDHDGMSPSIYTKQLFKQLHPWLSRTGILAINLNRAEQHRYTHSLADLAACCPDWLFRLPVPSPSRNEIIFCCKQAKPDAPQESLQQRATAWADHQPPIDFVDFANRLLPLKPTVWQQWLHRFNPH